LNLYILFVYKTISLYNSVLFPPSLDVYLFRTSEYIYISIVENLQLYLRHIWDSLWIVSKNRFSPQIGTDALIVRSAVDGETYSRPHLLFG